MVCNVVRYILSICSIEAVALSIKFKDACLDRVKCLDLHPKEPWIWPASTMATFTFGITRNKH